jgi:alkylation response protein AidB-like acyl-CoA dehydrogenase
MAAAAGLAGLGRTEEEGELVASLIAGIARLGAREIRALQIDRDGAIPQAVLEGLRELGVFGLSIPEKYGGAGLSLHAVGSVCSALARLDRSVATTVGLHLGLGTRGLIAYGGEALKAAWLPELATGRRIAAFSATESEAGSDLSAIALRASQSGPGRVRLDGAKIYVTNGGLAGVYTVAAASPGLGGAKKGHSIFLLLREDAGLRAEGEENKLGLRGSSTTSLALDGVDVPADRVIGEAGRGLEQLHHILAWGRTAMAAGCNGAAWTALQATVAHVTTRRQFGRTLASFEVVRGQLADLAALHFAMESIVAWTCAAEEQHAELGVRSTSAKIFCSEGDWEVCDTAVQLHGGMGFLEDTGLPLLLRDARITRIFEGANDVLLCALGALQLGPASRAGSAAGGTTARTPLAGRVSERLREAATRADALAEAISARRDGLRATFGMKLVSQQRHLHRLGRLIVLRDSCDAAVLRALDEGTDEAASLAAHWIGLAQHRAQEPLGDPPPLAHVDAAAAALLTRFA